MAHDAKKTKDHETIKHWAEERGGKPATVEGTAQGEEAGILRIDFPGRGSDENLKTITWDDFFEKFDSSDVVFLYQDKTEDGQVSRFNKFVHEESAA